MGGPAELREVDRLLSVAALRHQLHQGVGVRHRPHRAVVGGLRRLVGDSHVGVHRHDVEVPGGAGVVRLADPVDVDVHRPAEHDLHARVHGVRRGVRSLQQPGVLHRVCADEEVAGVRLVPDLPRLDLRPPALHQPREGRAVVGGVGRRHALALAAVRPAGSEPERQEHLHAAGARGIDLPLHEGHGPRRVEGASLRLQHRPADVDPHPAGAVGLELVELAAAVGIGLPAPGGVPLRPELQTRRRGRIGTGGGRDAGHEDGTQEHEPQHGPREVAVGERTHGPSGTVGHRGRLPWRWVRPRACDRPPGATAVFASPCPSGLAQVRALMSRPDIWSGAPVAEPLEAGPGGCRTSGDREAEVLLQPTG